MAIIQSGADTTLWTIDPTPNAGRVVLYDQNGNLLTTQDKTALPTTPTGVPFLAKQRDKIGRIPRCSRVGALGILDDEVLLYDPIEGSAVNTNIWTQSLSTFTISQANHAITFDPSQSTVAGAFAIHTSNKQFLKVPGTPLDFRAHVKIMWFANAVAEFGFGAPSGATTTVNDGCFFRKTTSGQLQAVVSYAGAETTQNLGTINITDYYTYEIVVEDDFAHFIVFDSTGNIISDVTQAVGVPTQAFIWSVTHLPVFFRLYNNTSPATGPELLIGAVSVLNNDLATNKSWAEQLSSLTKNAITSPTTFAQLANFANSAAPASATLSNTAAGYTTLGGNWQFAAVAGAATDFALFGFQNPTPYQLAITQIKIDAIVTGAAVATTATILQWGLAVNSNNVSLATAGTYPPMRISLGITGFVVGDAIGSVARGGPTIYQPTTPPTVEPGRFLHIILTIPVGTATASQVFRGTCLIEGHFE